MFRLSFIGKVVEKRRFWVVWVKRVRKKISSVRGRLEGLCGLEVKLEKL